VGIFLEFEDMLNGIVKSTLLYLDPQTAELILLYTDLALVDRTANKTVAKLFA
jgi:hypothetical protein